MQIIDGHCHVGIGREKQLTPWTLLATMDRYGVDKTVICPMEQYLAVFNEEGNRYILDAVKQHPDRFIGFATVNPWYGDEGIPVLKRALDSGCRGIKINSKIQGFMLAADIIKPFLRVAEEYRVPVYCHTGTMVVAEPFQLRELAIEFPKVNFIMGHSGNTDFWTDINYSVKGMDNLYLETSHNTSCGGLIAAAGADRVIFGSNMPRSHQGHEIENMRAQQLSAEVFEKVCGKNIARLIGG